MKNSLRKQQERTDRRKNIKAKKWQPDVEVTASDDMGRREENNAKTEQKEHLKKIMEIEFSIINKR